MYIDHQIFCSRGLPHPLRFVRLSIVWTGCADYRTWYTSLLSSLLLPVTRMKPAKKGFCHGADGVDFGHLLDPGPTRGDVETEKVFNRGQARNLNAPSEARPSLFCAGRRVTTLGRVSPHLAETRSWAAGQR